MIKYSIKRLAQSIVTLLILVSAVFLLMRLLPIEGYFGDDYEKLSPSQREAILDKMGLLDPWHVQLGRFYASLARAKGLPEKTIMFRHVMRNAYVPMAQYLPAAVLATISGSIYIESLYSIPAMGGLLVDVIQRQDNPMVQALVLIFSSVGILGLFLGDLLMAVFDPRIQLVKGEGSR